MYIHLLEPVHFYVYSVYKTNKNYYIQKNPLFLKTQAVNTRKQVESMCHNTSSVIQNKPVRVVTMSESKFTVT